MYSPDFREYVYQVWTYYCGRNAVRTAKFLMENREAQERLLQERPEPPKQETLVRQINYWAANYGWVEKARNDVERIAPDIWSVTVSDIIAGSAEAASFARRVLNYDEEQAQNFRDLSRLLTLKLEAAKLLLTAAGFGAKGALAQQDRMTQSQTPLALSEAERRSIISSLMESEDRLATDGPSGRGMATDGQN